MTPQCPKTGKWANESPKETYSILKVPMTKEMKLVLEILDSLQSEFSIDPARLYVTGQSMGGAGTWDIILRNPNLFAAAIPVCGNNDPSQAKRVIHLPIWVFHGEKDKTVPTKSSRDIVATLSKRLHHPNTAFRSRGGSPEKSELFARITAPTLILKANAEGDVRMQNEEVAGLLNNGRIAHVEGAGHSVHRDQKERLLKALKAFLGEL
jgi:pimeloyl-ACP methyl ester carboxylesterase